MIRICSTIGKAILHTYMLLMIVSNQTNSTVYGTHLRWDHDILIQDSILKIYWVLNLPTVTCKAYILNQFLTFHAAVALDIPDLLYVQETFYLQCEYE